MISFILFLYFCGVFGAIAGCGSWTYRFNRGQFKKQWLVILAVIIPIINYQMMWKCFKLYNYYEELERQYAKESK